MDNRDTRSSLSSLCDELIAAEAEYRRAARQHRIMGAESTRREWQRAKRRMEDLERAVRELLAEGDQSELARRTARAGSVLVRRRTNLGFGGLRCVQEKPL